MDARIVSVNVGLPHTVQWRGNPVSTGIFKEPVTGRVMVRRLNLDGDRQADLTVHGGADKAVYAYPAEHYPWWREQYPEMPLPYAQFGENLTTEGLREDDLRIGDRFRVGTAELVVAQPRFPCYKLGIRFGKPTVVKRFLASERSGVYFSVAQEGEVGAGDAITRTERGSHDVTIADIVRVYARDGEDYDMLRRIVAVDALPGGLRSFFAEQLVAAGESLTQARATLPERGSRNARRGHS